MRLRFVVHLIAATALVGMVPMTRQDATRARTLDQTIATILEEAEGNGGDPTDRILELGLDGLHGAFSLLAHGVPAASPARRHRASAAQRDVLGRAFDRFPRPVVCSLLEERLLAEDADERIAAMSLLARFGERRHARTLIACGETEARASPPDRRVLRAFSDALAAIARREPACFDTIRNAWSGASEPVREALLEALGETGRAEALELMLTYLTWGDREPAELIAWIDRFASRLDLRGARIAAANLRDYVSVRNTTTVKAVTLALGKLRDDLAVPRLVALVDHDDAGVRANAFWSLRAITGLPFDDRPGPWHAWLEEERAWLENEGATVSETLGAADPATVARTLNEIAQRRTERDRLAADVQVALEHELPSIRALACAVLERLGSPDGLPGLWARLDDPDPAVHEAALRALRSITGFDHPGTREAWRPIVERLAAPRRS